MIHPLLDRLLIKRLPKPESDSTIVVPDAFAQASLEFEVIAVGDFVVLGKEVFPLTKFVQPGDKVCAGEYNLEPVLIDGVEHHIVRVQDLKWVERVARD